MNSPWILAIGMMLMFEGIFPFFYPKQWRETFSRISRLADGQIRFFGLIVLLCGCGALGLAYFIS